MVPRMKTGVAGRFERKKHEEAWARANAEAEGGSTEGGSENPWDELPVYTLMATGTIHQFNLVGGEIISRVDGVRSVAQIAAEVGELFGWDDEETKEAVGEFLAGAQEAGWIVLE